MKKIFFTLGIAALMTLGACSSKNHDKAEDSDSIVTVVTEDSDSAVCDTMAVEEAEETPAEAAKETVKKGGNTVKKAAEETKEAGKELVKKADAAIEKAPATVKEKVKEEAKSAEQKLDDKFNKKGNNNNSNSDKDKSKFLN